MVKQGYSQIAVRDAGMVLSNSYRSMAISSNGQLFALANGNTVYLSKQDSNGGWQELQPLKKYDISDDDACTFVWPLRINALAFNEQGDKLGVIYSKVNQENNFEVLDLVGKEIYTKENVQ